MSAFSDTSSEMNPNGLSPDAAERLCNGEIDSPELSDLAAVVSELRALPAQESTPVPGAALSEFIGAGLVTNNTPAVSVPVPPIDIREEPMAAGTRRKKTVFAQIAAFAGTVGGKAAFCGAVAAASVTGGHATGVVDVPGLPDVKQEQVETINTDLAEAPEAIAVVDGGPTEAELAAEAEAKAKAEAEALAEAEAKAKAEAEEQAAKDEKHQKGSETLSDAEIDAKIAKLETEIANHQANLEIAIEQINSDFSGYVADIEASLETATDPEDIAHLEEYLETKHQLWDEMILNKEAETEKAIKALQSEIECYASLKTS